MNRSSSITVAALSALIAIVVVVSCGTSRKAADIRQRGLAPQLVLPGEDPLPEMDRRQRPGNSHHEGGPG